MTTGVPSFFSLPVKVEEGRKDGRRKRRGEDERWSTTKSKGYILSCGGKLGVTTNTTEQSREASKAHRHACTDKHARTHTQQHYTHKCMSTIDTHIHTHTLTHTHKHHHLLTNHPDKHKHTKDKLTCKKLWPLSVICFKLSSIL